MRDIIDMFRRRPWFLAAAVVFTLLAVLFVWLAGVHLWHGVLALFGIGAGSAPALRVYAQRDAERLRDQVEIERWKASEQRRIEAKRRRSDIRAARQEREAQASIDKAVNSESPEALRKRVLDAVRGKK